MSQRIFHFKPAAIVSLMKLYHQLDISESFVACADEQLTKLFPSLTGLPISEGVRLEWSRELDLQYKKDTISQINIMVCLKYGAIPAIITWQSSARKIYGIDDRTIDCDGIQFSFKDLDREACTQLVFPVWSLIPFKAIEIAAFKNHYGLDISQAFLAAADSQLSAQFQQFTGITLSDETALNLIKPPYEEAFEDLLTTGHLHSVLYINHHWNPVVIQWTSHSRRTYHVSDLTIDPKDIIFQFTAWEPEVYKRQI